LSALVTREEWGDISKVLKETKPNQTQPTHQEYYIWQSFRIERKREILFQRSIIHNTALLEMLHQVLQVKRKQYKKQHESTKSTIKGRLLSNVEYSTTALAVYNHI
jgi:hypothetical protein